MNRINFHHYGLAVKELPSSVKFHERLGYNCSEPMIEPIQNVELVFCELESYPSVELVKPINEISPINGYVKKNKAIVYHICYEIGEPECMSIIFKDNKVLWESKPQPAILFNNRLVSFHFVDNLGLIEILQK